ncbi:hypothetical protein [Pelosinus propionicus]|uniref:Uncharacterized protein n=1 Tax=Pelosinus propionicus DSM 13327 TaxID=1123291 RepID=A0A1I4HLF6_9FIRM|nr:hypothetical protein [Pelosinus propionicus]SFL42246.1 hypothetical protein SAMN04490355_100434 [Pelosinus propionicus DSM 13327]
MNKIRFLYDVMKTMKAKEEVKGILQVQVEKNQATILSLQNEFEKNLSTGEIKTKVTASLNYEGTIHLPEHHAHAAAPCSPERKHHEGLHHMHYSPSRRHGGLKELFSKWTFTLSLLNALQVKEEEKTTILSLDANDLSEDMKKLFSERIVHTGRHHRQSHGLLKEFYSIDHPEVKLSIFINSNYEIEKVVATAAGTQIDAQASQHDLNADAQVVFVWEDESDAS